MAFCKEYNAQTAKMIGEVIPVEITVYEVSLMDLCNMICDIAACVHALHTLA